MSTLLWLIEVYFVADTYTYVVKRQLPKNMNHYMLKKGLVNRGLSLMDLNINLCPLK